MVSFTAVSHVEDPRMCAAPERKSRLLGIEQGAGRMVLDSVEPGNGL